ncbi:hypothetical protein HON22_02320 [Candidatus Peregrinibacteria bacterium]|jgi:hypothetical protein|nr:hypothetical protein [Candidatus Peregrinibacteria bacterium]
MKNTEKHSHLDNSFAEEKSKFIPIVVLAIAALLYPIHSAAEDCKLDILSGLDSEECKVIARERNKSQCKKVFADMAFGVWKKYAECLKIEPVK